MRRVEVEPLWDVVEEHLDEAEFLWGVWQHSLVAPDYTLDEVAEGPEERLFAHLEGLVVGGARVAERLLLPALAGDEPSRVSAAALALLQGPRCDEALAAIAEVQRARPRQRAPLVRALACVELRRLRPRLRELLADHDDTVVAAAAEVLALHHEPLGDTLGLLLASDDAATRAMALRAVANEPDPGRFVRAVTAGLQELEPSVLDAAIDAGVRLGLAPAWARARERMHEVDGGAAMLLLALGGEDGDIAAIEAALADRKRRPAALWALGFHGTPEVVEAALEWLEDPVAGPLAGEVFSAVTGVDLAAAHMDLPREDDDALEHRPEDDLPRADPMAVLQWWTRHRERFVDGRRYVAGAAHSPEALVRGLRFGAMRRRPGYLLELTLALPPARRPRVLLAAPTNLQLLALEAMTRTLAGAAD
ncbi:TIGR02270 family protein [Nannocystis sp. ILAH1]|uniref:TIGR02270 family protein n=1 Tax=unclassified Nannocystis TaxID=2627009 RepID=UPI00226E0DD5|nr:MULTISPECIES: TIGR02270 family protein [unclassified Nannocystis]MCY0986564.1 TIGR02270 family protein [Nannocystis sp. ILAH1]MCY1071444.1 TIGR02270 family protein [Nannocystis sp. RBIL2]